MSLSRSTEKLFMDGLTILHFLSPEQGQSVLERHFLKGRIHAPYAIFSINSSLEKLWKCLNYGLITPYVFLFFKTEHEKQNKPKFLFICMIFINTVCTTITYRVWRVQLYNLISIMCCFFPISYYQCRISDRKQQIKLWIFFLWTEVFHNDIRAFNSYSMSMQYYNF